MECRCDAPFYGPPLTAACPGSSFLTFMSLVDTIFRSMCDVNDPCNRIRPITIPENEYDFIVVGGGGGGSAVAGRLAELRKWKVLVIEAGLDEPTVMQVPGMVLPFGTDKLTSWGYKVEPEQIACRGSPQNRCTWNRAKILGGCSAHHGLGYVRGVPKNYDDWEAAGNEGWSYKEVLPVFKRVEGNANIGRLVQSEYHGSEGPLIIEKYNYRPEIVLDLLKAAEQGGFPVTTDLNGKNLIGFATLQGNMRNGVRMSCAKAFLRPQRNNPGLDIMLNSTATKILINKDKTAIGVEFVYKSKTFRVRARKEVILAGGSINTPQLLLLSGVGPREVLDKVGIKQVHDLRGVGKNLTDHVLVDISFSLKKVKNFNDLNWDSLREYIRSRGGPLSAPGLTQMTARLFSKYADQEDNPDLLFIFRGFASKCSQTGEVGAPLDPEHPDAYKSIVISPTLLQPLSRGHITLRSKNPLEAPIMVANYLTASEDQERLLDGIRIILNFTDSPLLKQKYGIEVDRTKNSDCFSKHKFNSDNYWRCVMFYSTAAGEHQTSSCRMGPLSDPFAVVDHKLRVHGIKHLRIADASVMPSIISGNTLATVVMIAERTTDFIKEEWN